MATLWTGGKIYTMAQVGETVEAVLEEDGKIVATGSVESLSPLATSTRHLQGNVMYPGFVDSHLHIIGYGEKLKHIDVSAITSKEALLAKLQERMSKVSSNEWVIAIGLNETNLKSPFFLL